MKHPLDLHLPLKNMRILLTITSTTILLNLLSQCTCYAQSPEHGDGIYTVIIKKQEKKRQERWSLASWYETKEKIRLMDMWLALHTSSSLYEFFVGGDTATVDVQSDLIEDSSHVIQRGEVGAYASIFGLQVQYEDLAQVETGWKGSFHFRLLGTAVQNTNLTLMYGVRNRNDHSNAQEYRNHFAGASMTLYLHRVFGIEGRYQVYFPNSSKEGFTLEGTRTEASLFLDYSLLRIYGTWFEEPLTYFSGSDSLGKITRRGVLGGLRLFF